MSEDDWETNPRGTLERMKRLEEENAIFREWCGLNTKWDINELSVDLGVDDGD